MESHVCTFKHPMGQGRAIVRFPHYMVARESMKFRFFSEGEVNRSEVPDKIIGFFISGSTCRYAKFLARVTPASRTKSSYI